MLLVKITCGRSPGSDFSSTYQTAAHWQASLAGVHLNDGEKITVLDPRTLTKESQAAPGGVQMKIAGGLVVHGL